MFDNDFILLYAFPKNGWDIKLIGDDQLNWKYLTDEACGGEYDHLVARLLV